MEIRGLVVALAAGRAVPPANRRPGDPDISYGGGRTPIFLSRFPNHMPGGCGSSSCGLCLAACGGRIRRHIRYTRRGLREGLTGREPGGRLPWSQARALHGKERTPRPAPNLRVPVTGAPAPRTGARAISMRSRIGITDAPIPATRARAVSMRSCMEITGTPVPATGRRVFSIRPRIEITGARAVSIR